MTPKTCPICGSLDLIGNRCTQCGTDISKIQKEDNHHD